MGGALSLCANPQSLDDNEESGSSTPPGIGRRNSYCSPQLGNQSAKTFGAAWNSEQVLPQHIVGTFSNHGLKPDFGGRCSAKINQDRGLVCWPLADDKEQALFCVFDGHGSEGERVSEYSMLQIQKKIENDSRLKENPSQVLIDACLEVDRALPKCDFDSMLSGTTAIIVLIQKDKIWSACVGDSRAVAGIQQPGGTYKAEDLSEDQKADSPIEQQRVLEAGGYVSPAGYGPARVWLSPGVGPGLAMGRSIGDHLAARVGVIAEPVIATFRKTPDWKYMIVASDGVWEFISSQEALDIVTSAKNVQEGCVNLIKASSDQWRKQEGNYRDDITAVVVTLPCFPKEAVALNTDDIADVIVDDDLEEDVAEQLVPNKSDEKTNTFAQRKLSMSEFDDAAIQAALKEADKEQAAK